MIMGTISMITMVVDIQVNLAIEFKVQQRLILSFLQVKWILIKYSKHFSVGQACSGWVTWVEEWVGWVAAEWAAIVRAVSTFSSAKCH